VILYTLIVALATKIEDAICHYRLIAVIFSLLPITGLANVFVNLYFPTVDYSSGTALFAPNNSPIVIGAILTNLFAFPIILRPLDLGYNIRNFLAGAFV